MSSSLVDGLVLPVALAGHPALDFCNTRAGWAPAGGDSPGPKEYLNSYQHLAVWTREAGLVAPDTTKRLMDDSMGSPALAQAVLDSALALREATYRVVLGSRSSTAFALIGRQVKAARRAATLRPAGAQSDALAHWVTTDERLDAPLLAVAAQLDDLLCSPLSACIAACPGRGCGWVFADPRRRRRWCDMAVCGNRAKARRHAERVAIREKLSHPPAG